ncbi:LuxR family transcriptional regulator [Aeromicrobium sp. Root236]|uniref:response regulator transcription factor n=1 Tax=Aeromicrobium sp. Root236 TaxID=1736498 RepID=UPI0006F7DBB9|nr:response regulator transcription factor [Aeromicrobium sp. Root236]KRC65319.1 LuxR family transcriptional regulator [Aeromicrobium sp. Root236]
MTVGVVIVDDDALVRSGLAFMLRAANGIEVLGEASDGDEVIDAVTRLRPDVVLMDLRMARVGGIQATRMLRELADAPEVIVLTTFDADADILAALAAGAAGFLLKDTPPAEIVRAIETVAGGEPLLSPTVTRRLMDLAGALQDTGARDIARSRLATLTDRERTIALALGDGLSNSEIAGLTYLSTATIKAYVSRLFEKLHVTNRVQVALLVQQAELSR